MGTSFLSTFHSRIARAGDQKKIAKLCKRAVGLDDYVLNELSGVIHRKHLFLAFSGNDEDALIGMSNYTPIFDKSAWLGMARTDPAWRGLGVAQFLQESMASYSKRHGVNALRFFVSSTNTSSLRAAKKGGFKAMAEVSHVSLKPGSNALPGHQSHSNSNEIKHSLGQVYEEVLSSRYVKAMNGYISRGYAFVKVNRKNIKWITSHNELFSYDDHTTFILCKTEPTQGQFSLLSGGTRQCLANILRKSREMKLRTLGGFLPNNRNVIYGAARFGFERDSWAKRGFLFEKKV
jgi:GNAT superfamily N-acetyltransferase